VSESATFRAKTALQGPISAIFHSFFHRCGKLWGETKRAWKKYGRNSPEKEADSNTPAR